MKSSIRIGTLVVALGLAGLLAGCTSPNSQTSRRARDFEVVETSTKRTLTPKEMAKLQEMVADYLEKQGVTESGDYYVKVFLTAEKDGVPGEWVVVRYSQPTGYVATNFSLLSSYPDYGYSSYYPRYNFDYYPFGWFGFSAFALSYYDDPFYYYGGHHRRGFYSHHGDRRWDRDHRRDRDRDHNHPGGNDDRDRPRGDNRPPAGLKPSFKPSEYTSTPQDNPSSRDNRSRGNHWSHSNRSDSRQRWRDRDSNNTPAQAGTGTSGTSTNSPPTPAVAGSSGSTDRSYHGRSVRDRNPAEHNPPPRDPSPSGRQISGGQERSSSSGRNFPLKPSHDNRRQESSREVQSAAYTPPARSDPPPAPAYNPPSSRSESNESPRAKSGDGSHDGGRSGRSE
jgi:hypothetical protein